MLDVIQNHRLGLLEVAADGVPLWRYRYLNTPKPHVAWFATPAGHNTALVSPHDHVHHRGLMLGFTVDDVNFWEETQTDQIPQTGSILHAAFPRLELEASRLTVDERLVWQKGAEVYLEEQRTLTVWIEPDESAVRCDWTSQLHAVGQDRALTGQTPHAEVTYHGLGYRFDRSLDWGGHHLTPQGRIQGPPDPGRTAPWHEYAGCLDGSHAPVGVWIGDAPGNPRHPTPWVCRSHPPTPFVLVSASLLAHDPYRLEPGQPLTLSYSIWVHDGHWTPDDGDRVWANAFR
ncbi:MAG: DUF6807 family protein [Planctomycetota bacterium]